MARTLEVRAREQLPPAQYAQVLYREVWLNAKQSVLFQRYNDGNTWQWKRAAKFPDYKEVDARAMLPDANDPDTIAMSLEICLPDESTRTFYRKQIGMKSGYPVYKWTRQNGNT